MVEIARRNKNETGQLVGVYYYHAIKDYLSKHKVPKRLEIIDRHQYRFNVPEDIYPLLSELEKIARNRHLEMYVLMDEVLELWLQRPENYLDAEFYKQNRRRFEG